jgi:hypothetical protein
VTDAPIVGSDGIQSRAVVFRIQPLDPDGVRPETFEVDGGRVAGETLERVVQLQEKKSVTVELPPSRADTESEKGRKAIVDLALDQAKSESA